MTIHAKFIPIESGKELYHGTRGQLRRCDPAIVTDAWTGESLDAIRAAHGIIAPPPPVPRAITPSQLRLQLVADGKSAARVEAIIGSLPEPLRTQAAIMFDYSVEFRRAHPLLIQLAHILGYDTPQKLDAFFIAAAAR